MAEATTGSKRGFLEGLAGLIRRSAPTGAKQDAAGNTFVQTARELDSAVQSLRSKISTQREALARQSSSSTLSTFVATAAKTGPSQKELQRRDLEQSVAQMRSYITELHSKLGTGISEQELAGTEEYLSALCEQLPGPDLDARIRVAIAERVYGELGPISWALLKQFMERAGTEWPEPSGLTPRVTEEQRALAVEHHMQDAETIFLGQSLTAGIESMRGVISTWKRYPDRSNWLWEEVGLRGVAAGIRGRLMQSAVEKLRADAAMIRAKGHELLDEHMSKIESVVQSGIHSLDDAEKVVQGTELIVKNLLPDLAWQHVDSCVNDAVAQLVQPH